MQLNSWQSTDIQELTFKTKETTSASLIFEWVEDNIWKSIIK